MLIFVSIKQLQLDYSVQNALTGVNITLNAKYRLNPKAAHWPLRLETLHMWFGNKYFRCGRINMRIEMKFCDKFLENVSLLDVDVFQ